MDIYTKPNTLLKLELKKSEFVNKFYEKLKTVDITNNLYDIIYMLVVASETFFYLKNKRTGATKRQAVIEVIERVKKSNIDIKIVEGLIEQILANNDIQVVPWYKLLYRRLKAFFHKST